MSNKEQKSEVEAVAVPADAAPAAARPVGAEKWAANSIFDRKDERKMGKAMSGSLIAHGVLFAVLIWGGFHAAKAIEQPPDKIDMVYLQQPPGPGGGGGGSPKPAPPAKTEVPKPAPTPPPTPVEPVPVVTPPPPDPSLVAPVTTLSNMMQASGQSVNLAAFGGGGTGGGVGSGTGNGVGPGTGGGFGGGAYRPGNGCANPTLVRQVDPKYTSEAMRAKLQGDVEIEAVVQKDGRVGDLQLSRSLDKQFGLDEEAMKAAKQWVFRPAVCKGQPVDMIVTLQLQFRLH